MTRIRIKDLDPQFRRGVRLMPPIPFHRYWMVKVFRCLTPFLFPRTCPTGVSYNDTQLGSAGVRVYRGPGEPSGIGVLWIHGGGFIAGSNLQDNKMCSRYVQELDAVVCSVEYRLAPEQPYPAGLDDCYEAWQWFVEHAAGLGADPSRLIIAGQSGGGGMTASLAQRICDAGGVQPAAQLLFCPMLDDRTGAKRELDAVKHFGWTNRSNRAAWSWYTGCEAGAAEVPTGSVPARREDLRGLPPAWIGIGDLDLFYEESALYARRLKSAGVPVVFDVVADAPHGVESLSANTPLVRDYFARHFAAVRQLLATPAGQ